METMVMNKRINSEGIEFTFSGYIGKLKLIYIHKYVYTFLLDSKIIQSATQHFC